MLAIIKFLPFKLLQSQFYKWHQGYSLFSLRILFLTFFYIELAECVTVFYLYISLSSPGYFKYHNPIPIQFTFTALFALTSPMTNKCLHAVYLTLLVFNIHIYDATNSQITCFQL